MALVGRFEPRPLEPKRVHDEVLCGYAATDIGGRRILQLVTYRSSSRQNSGTVSQTLQLDRGGAAELKRIIESAFPSVVDLEGDVETPTLRPEGAVVRKRWPHLTFR